MKTNRPTFTRVGWSKSDEWREISRQAIRRWNANRPNLPKCKATARSTGEPCQQLALENGCCRFHGGKTPRGDAWHRPQWPSKASPNAENKLARKLNDRDHRARKHARRLSAMTIEERATYDAWKKTHSPGASATRAADRARRTQNKAARAIVSAAATSEPDNEELRVLRAARAVLEDRLRALECGDAVDVENYDQGIFG